MIDNGKRCILGVNVDVIDYEAALLRIFNAAASNLPLPTSALAVHGLMTGYSDPVQRYRLNHLALIVPDGQPIRWALRLLHREALPSRVYGPELMLRVCAAAAQRKVAIYLYGSRPSVLERLVEQLLCRYPNLTIAGKCPSRFSRVSDEENSSIIEAIRSSGARITLVGLGCPRQEIWAYENAEALKMPVLAVGAAFDFHAGSLSQAPTWMQDRGLEWLYRLGREPRRLWRRYLLLGPKFCWALLLQLVRSNEGVRDKETRPMERMNFA